MGGLIDVFLLPPKGSFVIVKFKDSLNHSRNMIQSKDFLGIFQHR